MYIPNAFKMAQQEELVHFMRQYSFATLVSQVADQLFASHLPLVVDATAEQVTLRGHFAKANPHWQAHQTPGHPLLVIFQGPHAYIAPSQYTVTEAVPTWNYVAVHAYGELQLLPTGEPTVAALEAMFATFDASFQQQWQSLSAKYKQGMLNGIVAFAITVTRLEGKAKLSQNRPPADQQAVSAWLLGQEGEPERTIGHLMQAQLTTTQ